MYWWLTQMICFTLIIRSVLWRLLFALDKSHRMVIIKWRCPCCCQMLLGIHTTCAGVLFSSLDVGCHFPPVVAWLCCWPSYPIIIKRWKCQLRSLAHAQSGISVFFLQNCQFDWSHFARRPTRGVFFSAHSRSFEMPRCRTKQFSRSFVLSCVRLWNGLHGSVFVCEGVGAFKTSVNRFLLQGWLPAVSSCPSTVSFSTFLFPGLKIAWGSFGLIGFMNYKLLMLFLALSS